MMWFFSGQVDGDLGTLKALLSRAGSEHIGALSGAFGFR